MAASSRPRPAFRPERLVTPGRHQIVTDGLIKRFATEDDRTAAYTARQTDLNLPVTAVPPPYEGEPSQVWNGMTWGGIEVWQGHAWKPLRQPFPGDEGLITVEIDDAAAIVPEPELGQPAQYLQFSVTMIGEPRSRTTVEYQSEERDPRSLADRARKNADGTDAVPNPDPGGATLGVDFLAVQGTLVFDPADRANDDFQATPIELDGGRTGYLTKPGRLAVEVLPDIAGGEGAERCQMRLQNPHLCRIDRPIGIGIIASSQQPVVRISDTSVSTSHAAPVAGQPRQIVPTTAYFTVSITRNQPAADSGTIISFTARTRDITATAGTDYVALDGSTLYTIPAGESSVRIPVTIPAQPTEGPERFGITLGTLSANAVFATNYAECVIQGTPASPRFYMEGNFYGALYGEPEPRSVTIPFYIVPAATAGTVIDYWTSPSTNNPGTTSDYEHITEANRRQITISPGTTRGSITLNTYIFRNRQRDIAAEPNTSRPEREVQFSIALRRRSGAELDGVANDTTGEPTYQGLTSLGLPAYAGGDEEYTITIGQGRPRTGTETEGDQPSEDIKARFPVTINKAPEIVVAVTASTSTGGNFGTAESGVDFVAKTQTIQWGIGDTARTKYFDVDIVEETVAEPDEYFSAIIRNPTPADRVTVTTARGTYTILGEAAPPGRVVPSVSISSAEIVRPETGVVRLLTFPISISAAPTTAASVDVTVRAASATAGTHYRTTALTSAGFTGTPSSVSWQANDGEGKSVGVLILGGDNLERPVQFVVELSNPSGVQISQAQARGSILVREEPDTPTRPRPTRRLPAVGIADSVSADEEDAGYIEFAVTLARQTSATATVDYVTAGLGTCVAGEDYDLTTQESGRVSQRRTTSGELSGRVTFGPNQTSHNIRVGIINDDDVEPNEQFEVRLSAPVNCELDPNRSVGTGRITSEDQPPTVRQRPSVTITAVRRVGNNVLFTISLSHLTAAAVTGEFSTSAGTAVAGTDYNPVGREVSGAIRGRSWTIRANTLATTQTVSLIEGSGVASRRSFTGYIENVSANATLGSATRRTYFIPARQAPDPVTTDSSLSVSVDSHPAARGDNIVVAVSRTGSVANPVAANLLLVRGTATVGDAATNDLAPFERAVSLGRTISRVTTSIPSRVPATDQPAETAYVVLSNPTGTGARLSSNVRSIINLPAFTLPTLIAFANPVILIKANSTLITDRIIVQVAFPVVLTRPATQPVTFDYTASLTGTYAETQFNPVLPLRVSGSHTIPVGSDGGLIVMDSGPDRGKEYLEYGRIVGLSRLFRTVTAVIAGLSTFGLSSVAIGFTSATSWGPPVLGVASNFARVNLVLGTGFRSVAINWGTSFPTALGVGSATVSSAISAAMVRTGGGINFVSGNPDLSDGTAIGLGTTSILSGTDRSNVFEALVLTSLRANLTVRNIRGTDNAGTVSVSSAV